MTEYADLEIGLHRRDAGTYTIEFRFSQPNSEADVRLDQGQPAQAAFDLVELKSLADDPLAYGTCLTQSFFAEPAVQTAFAQARASAQSLGALLRIRLMIGSSASELQGVHWEMLRDPQDGSPLSTSENLLFSRYLSSLDWRPVRLRAKGELRALAMVANPSDLAGDGLAPIDVEGEMARARLGLGEIRVNALPEPDGTQRATLNNLVATMRESEYDILYLVCHGALVKEEPWLWLEDDQGYAARTSGAELVTRLNELGTRPRLLVLASCESAGARAEMRCLPWDRVWLRRVSRPCWLCRARSAWRRWLSSCPCFSTSCSAMVKLIGPWRWHAGPFANDLIAGCRPCLCV